MLAGPWLVLKCRERPKHFFWDLIALSSSGAWLLVTVTFLSKPLFLWLGEAICIFLFSSPPVYSLLSFFSSLPLNSSVRNTCQRCRSGHIVSYNRAVCKECRASGSAHALRLYSLGGCRVPVYYVYISHSWPLGPPVCSQPLWSPLILPCPSLLPYLLTHCFWAEVYHSSGSSLYHYEILIASPVPL